MTNACNSAFDKDEEVEDDIGVGEDDADDDDDGDEADDADIIDESWRADSPV